MSADSPAPPSLRRIIIAASIGNALEWFDFLIYGYFAVTIWKLFFGGFAPFVATWLIAVTRNNLSPSFYLMFTAGLSIIGLTMVRRRALRR